MPETGGAPVLEVAGLRKEFGALVAVDDVSFVLPPGRSIAIVGESGSGKTTIARMIVGLERPTRGTITACGHDRSRPVRSARDRRRRGREVQIVFQDPYTSLDPRQTAEATIDEVLRLHHGWPAGRRRARVAELTELVGLDTRQARALPRSLSGGQRQRLVLARALLAEAEILILVEPTSAVDAHTEARIAQRLREARRGRTTVVMTGSPLVLDQADRVVLIADGRVAATGTHRELLRSNAAYRFAVTREDAA